MLSLACLKLTCQAIDAFPLGLSSFDVGGFVGSKFIY